MQAKWLVAAVAAMVAGSVYAADVQVSNAWARPTMPAQPVGAAYVTLTSAANAELVKVGSPVARKVELHTMTMKDGMMEMREIASLPLPAGKAVTLQPGGNHIMLIDLSKPLRVGDHVPLHLTVKQAGGKLVELDADAVVAEKAPGGQMRMDHGHDMNGAMDPHMKMQ